MIKYNFTKDFTIKEIRHARDRFRLLYNDKLDNVKEVFVTKYEHGFMVIDRDNDQAFDVKVSKRRKLKEPTLHVKFSATETENDKLRKLCHKKDMTVSELSRVAINSYSGENIFIEG